MVPPSGLQKHHCHKIAFYLGTIATVSCMSWRALGSVKHEGPATRMWQKEDRCHALSTRSLAKRTLDRCGWVHLGTIAHNLHIVWKTALFYILLLALGCILATFASTIPVFSAWHCAFHAPAFPCHRETNFCHAGGWHLRRKPCVGYFFNVLPRFSCGILASLSHVFVALIPHCLD